MSGRRLVLFLNAVLGMLILPIAGCSKSGHSTTSTTATSGPPAELPKPCSLITQAEVEAALGKGASMTADANPRTGMEECNLKPARATDSDSLVLVLHETTPQDWERLKKTYAQDNSAEKITGLGDDALNLGLYGVWVRKGNTYMQIYGAIDNQRQEKAELFLAEKAVSRL